MTEQTIAEVANTSATVEVPCPEEVLAILAGISDKAVLDAIVKAVKERKGSLKTAPKVAKVVELPATGTSTYAVVKGRTVFGVVIGSRAAAGKGAPAVVKLLIGEGVDAETFTVFPSQLVSIEEHAAKAEAAAAAASEVTEV